MVGASSGGKGDGIAPVDAARRPVAAGAAGVCRGRRGSDRAAGRIAAMPLLVIEHEHLIEKQADMMGLGTVAVRWAAPDKSARSMRSTAAGATSGSSNSPRCRRLGRTDRHPAGVARSPPAADAVRAGDPQPQGSHDPRFHRQEPHRRASTQDFGSGADARNGCGGEWGPEHYGKLIPLMVARPDAEAAAALISGRGDIDAFQPSAVRR